MLTHRNLAYNVQQLSAWFADARPGKEVFLACLPYFHVFGMTVSMNYPVPSLRRWCSCPTRAIVCRW